MSHLNLQQFGLGFEGKSPVLVEIAHFLERVLDLAALERLSEKVVYVASGSANAIVELGDIAQDLDGVREAKQELVVKFLHLAKIGLKIVYIEFLLGNILLVEIAKL